MTEENNQSAVGQEPAVAGAAPNPAAAPAGEAQAVESTEVEAATASVAEAPASDQKSEEAPESTVSAVSSEAQPSANPSVPAAGEVAAPIEAEVVAESIQKKSAEAVETAAVAAASITPSIDADEFTANGKKLSIAKILGIAAVLLIILVIIFYATRQPAALTLGGDGQRVRVSDSVEQGKVSIIEETKADIKVLVDSDGAVKYDRIPVSIYLGNTAKNPNSADCALVYSLERQTDKKYDSNMINTMIGLLEPLSAAEKEQGFYSAIPAGTYLKYLKLDDSGVMTVNLTGNISKAAGSCAVTAIKSQVRATIMQFAAVNSVVICIDGECREDLILQP